MNTGVKEYLQASPTGRRAVLKKQYLENMPRGASERNCALFHLGYLVAYTRRLNLVECKSANQPLPKPSALRKTDLFLCVEVCTEIIRENTLLKSDAEFWRCWTTFEGLLERVKSKDGPESFFETAYLLLYLAGLIFRRRVADGAIEKEPQIFSLEGYKSVAAGFARPLFESMESPADQLENLTSNLQSLAHTSP